MWEKNGDLGSVIAATHHIFIVNNKAIQHLKDRRLTIIKRQYPAALSYKLIDANTIVTV